MAVAAKIPFRLYGQNTACGGFVVFERLLKAGPAFTELERQDRLYGLPAFGYIKIKSKRYWYCRYGLVEDRNIYTK